MLLVLAAPAWAQDDDASPEGSLPATTQAPVYRVSEFTLRYLHPGHPQHPAAKILLELPIELGREDDGFVAPGAAVEAVTITLAGLGGGPVEAYDASAIQTILETLRDELIRRDLLGVYVAPDPQDIDTNGVDLRPPNRTQLRLLISTAIVTDLRTVASGKRVDPDHRINNPVHQWMRDESPIQPGADDPQTRRDLLRRDSLDEFVFYLSRRPGRRVDVAVSPADIPGGVTLDYLITENRPWSVYSQTSNTGTSQTDTIRQRFGFIHNQLTNNDDTFLFDYMTSFDAVHALTTSYSAPIPDTERWRWRVFGGWNEYTAREVGVFLDLFKGSSWAVGGEVSYNFYQRRDLFLDLLFGLRFQNIKVDNRVTSTTGDENFLLPNIGVQLDHRGDWYRNAGLVLAEWNMSSITQSDPTQLDNLGRLFPDVDFGLLRWDLRSEVYIEPLLNRAAWDDPATPSSSTLAHEIAVGFRGQWAAGNRLVPQFEQVIGGLYTVRGYDQSLLAGDSVLVLNAEYRFHLPRALGLQPVPSELFGEPFRFVPQTVYGRPDWDLILRAFVDVGRTFISDRLPFESEATLIGSGIGVELQLKSNLDVRIDWGIALRDVPSRGVSAGSSQVYFVLSLAF